MKLSKQDEEAYEAALSMNKGGSKSNLVGRAYNDVYMEMDTTTLELENEAHMYTGFVAGAAFGRRQAQKKKRSVKKHG